LKFYHLKQKKTNIHRYTDSSVDDRLKSATLDMMIYITKFQACSRYIKTLDSSSFQATKEEVVRGDVLQV